MKPLYLVEIGIEQTAEGWDWKVDFDFEYASGVADSEQQALDAAFAVARNLTGPAAGGGER